MVQFWLAGVNAQHQILATAVSESADIYSEESLKDGQQKHQCK